MMSNEGYRDRTLTCRDCGNAFTFSAGEQEFFASKGLTNAPNRCSSCRAQRRGAQPSSRAPRGEQHEAVCATCGRTTSVPFVPREDRPVYCNECFQTQRASRPRRDDAYSYSNTNSSGGRGRNRRDNGRDHKNYW